MKLLIPLLIISIVFVAGCTSYTQTKSEDKVLEDGTVIKPDGTMVKPDGTMIKSDGTIILPNGTITKGMVEKKTEETVMKQKQYSGTVLAGSSSPLIDFNTADYTEAINSDKLVVLYFYANWCPICRAEVPHLYSVFNELKTDKVVGFRVNFNDDQTDSDEVSLARQYGVPYQHTKVFVKNGQSILKSTETWDKNIYLVEINRALVQ